MTSRAPAPAPFEGKAPGGLRALPAGVWALGFGSLLMDVSSELIHSLLPLFMVTTLGASMITVGLLEGVAEATAAIMKVFSGALSDFLGRRKALMVFGYALGALTKPVFPLASSVGWVFGARFVDRMGKGIRGAPRDALLAEITTPPQRGAAFGLRQALDSVGAFLGPLLAMVFMVAFSNDLRRAMWFATLPAFLTVIVLLAYVREPERSHSPEASRKPLSFRDVRRLPRAYRMIVLLGGFFTLARFSEAFLVLRARDVGLELGLVPVVMVVMNFVYAGAAYPAGAAADRLGGSTLLLFGLIVLIVSDLALAFWASPGGVLSGAALWGLHMALTQGLFSKLVADTAPKDLLGTAFGVFNLVSGLSLVLASGIAGALWSTFGAPATFLAGAAFAAVAALGVLGSARGR